jgi:hypothetical protein
MVSINRSRDEHFIEQVTSRERAFMREKGYLRRG